MNQPTTDFSRKEQLARQQRIDEYERLVGDRDRWRVKNKAYYGAIERLVRFVVPDGASVLEIGSETGDLLAACKPEVGVGVDIVPGLVERARNDGPRLPKVPRGLLIMPALRLSLPPKGIFVPNNAVDPMPFYYRPIIGKLFVARLNTGLRLLDGRFTRLLEVGYGSGLLIPVLAAITDQLYGVDLEETPPTLPDNLARLGIHPEKLVRADIQQLPFPDGHFDGAVAFSILEHLKEAELTRALAAVHKAMNAAFSAIGFKGIEHHHFSGLPDVLRASAPHFKLDGARPCPAFLLFPWAGRLTERSCSARLDDSRR
jgi:SAM-dependent methyltransferase